MKKILSLVLACASIISLVSCGEQKENPSEDKKDNNPQEEVVETDLGVKYLNKLKAFSPREKNVNNTKDNQEFENYLNDLFNEIACESYSFMHSNFTDYKAYGLTKPEVQLGRYEYDNSEEIAKYEQELETLLSFDYSALSYREQYYYDMYEYSLYETLASLAYDKYNLLFSEANMTFDSLSSLLVDWKIYDKESLDDYIIILHDVDDYIDSIIDFTKQQAEDGLYHANVSIEYSCDYIGSFLSYNDENVILTSFVDRIYDFDFGLSDSEIADYIMEVTDTVLDEIIPAYEKALEYIQTQFDKATIEDNILCNIDKNYAELQYLLSTSTNDGIDALFEAIEDRRAELYSGYISAYRKYGSNIANQYSELENTIKNEVGSSYQDILDYLSSNMLNYVPSIGKIDYDVSALDSSMSEGSILAYYVSSPLDDPNQNIIKVNENNMGDDIVTAYTTLAHEGFPGHLYQHVYLTSTDPNKFVYTQNFIGYTEGWAVMMETEAINLIDDSAFAKFVAFNDTYYFYDYSLMDIGINYYGWSEDELQKYMSKLGYDTGYSTELYEFFVSMAGVYCNYGGGASYMYKLKNEAEDALGNDFNIVSFNESILKHGHLPFALLEQSVNEYINSNK